MSKGDFDYLCPLHFPPTTFRKRLVKTLSLGYYPSYWRRNTVVRHAGKGIYQRAGKSIKAPPRPSPFAMRRQTYLSAGAEVQVEFYDQDGFYFGRLVVAGDTGRWVDLDKENVISHMGRHYALNSVESLFPTNTVFQISEATFVRDDEDITP